MSTFLTKWGLAIVIALAVLGVLIWAEWRDHRDGIYDDDDTDEPGSPDGTHTVGANWHLEPHTIGEREPADW